MPPGCGSLSGSIWAYEWFTAGLHKLTPAWLDGGGALKGFWERAIIVPDEGRPAIAFGWYRDFIEFMLGAEAYTWFSPLIVYGEILIGIGLIVGAFVGISAFFGALLNWNFIMAGAASTNAVLFTLAILLMLAWKVAGYIGLDYWLLSWLGTPWPYTNKNAEAVGSPDPKFWVARKTFTRAMNGEALNPSHLTSMNPPQPSRLLTHHLPDS